MEESRPITAEDIHLSKNGNGKHAVPCSKEPATTQAETPTTGKRTATRQAQQRPPRPLPTPEEIVAALTATPQKRRRAPDLRKVLPKRWPSIQIRSPYKVPKRPGDEVPRNIWAGIAIGAALVALYMFLKTS